MSLPRWIYRCANYRRAVGLLEECCVLMESRPLTALEQEGMVQRFEYSWELAWKVLKDYLNDQGVMIEPVTPAATIRAAFAAGIIDNAPIWMEALDMRNKLSHTYSHKTFEEAAQQIHQKYIPLFVSLRQWFDAQEAKE